MARSSQQARRDLINVQRLLTSLEAAAFSIKPDRPLLTEEELPGADYFGTLSTITSIKYAKRLIETGEDSIASRNNVMALDRRLHRLEQHYKTLLEATPAPVSPQMIKPSIESLRPKLVQQPTPDSSFSVDDEQFSILSHVVNPALAPVETDKLLFGDNESLASAYSPSRIPSASTKAPSTTAWKSTSDKSVTPASGASSIPTTQSMTTLLSHHRSEQDLLTSELAQMASRLKMNSLSFASLLESDKVSMEGAEAKLETNLGGMTKQRERLKGYSKKGGVTLWFTIGSVVAVTLAWFIMFGLMRIA